MAITGQKSKGSGSSTQTTSLFQEDELRNLLDRASGSFDNGGFFAADPFGGIDPIAGRTTNQQDTLAQLISQGGSLAGDAFSNLQAGLGEFDPNNAAITGAIDAVAGDVNRNLTRNILPAVGSAATSAGQFGGSRQGIAEGLALSDANQQISDVASQLRLQDLNSFQDRQANFLSNLGGINQGLQSTALGAGDIERADRQAQIDVELEQFARESGLELANLQAFRDLISGNFGGTTTGTQKQNSTAFGFSG